MSKGKKFFISITAVFCALALAFYVFTYIDRWWYYRIHYHGDRITVMLSAAVDGRQINSENIKVKYAQYNPEGDIYESGNGNIRLKEDNGYSKFSIKAYGYGDYAVYTDIDGYAFYLTMYQWNWWDVQEIRLHIDIDTEKNTFSVNESHSNISEPDGYKKISIREEEAVYPLNEYNTLFIGAG